jgi:hypothetical protein
MSSLLANFDLNARMEIAYSVENTCLNRLQMHREFFARLVTSGNRDVLNGVGDRIADLLLENATAALNCSEQDRQKVLKVVKDVHDELQEARYHFRTLLDGADGLSIGASATGFVGVANGWNPVGWIMMALSMAQAGSQIGMMVEGNKAKSRFMILLNEAHKEIKKRLSNASCIDFVNSMAKLTEEIKMVHPSVDPAQMYSMLILPLMSVALSGQHAMNRTFVRITMANYANFYLNTNAGDIVKNILAMDKALSKGDSLDDLVLNLRTMFERGLMPAWNGVLIGLSLSRAVFTGVLHWQEKTISAAINAFSGVATSGHIAIPKFMIWFSRLSKFLGPATMVLSVITIGFNIYSLVDRAKEMEMLDEKIKTSRKNNEDYLNGIFDFVAALKNPSEERES